MSKKPDAVTERILILLREQKMTGSAFARKMGMPQSTFSAWKNGNGSPKASQLGDIAAILNVSVDYLANGGIPETQFATEAEKEFYILATKIAKYDEEAQRLVLESVRSVVEGFIRTYEKVRRDTYQETVKKMGSNR